MDAFAALPPVLEPNRRRVARGSGLPVAGFAYNKATGAVSGTFLLNECAYSAVVDRCAWKVARYVELLAPAVLRRDDLAWCSTVVHLQKPVEARLRAAAIVGGGVVSDAFPDVVGQRWWAWPLDDEQRTALRAGAPTTLLTTRRMADACRVIPEEARSFFLT